MRKKRMILTRASDESGQSLVEFSLVVLIFLTIVFLIMDFAWIAYQKAAFQYGCSNASWDSVVTKDTIDDPAFLVAGGEEFFPNDVKMEEQLRNCVKKACLGGSTGDIEIVKPADSAIKDETGSVRYVVCRNSVQDSAYGQRVVRKMTINMDLRYKFKPLTPFGKTLFGDIVVDEATVNTTRIIGSSDRQE